MRRYEVEMHYISINNVNGFIYTTYSIPDNDDRTVSDVIKRAFDATEDSGKTIRSIRIRERPC